MKKYLFLTGAGISAESGIRTFRDSGGLWEDLKVEDVASPLGFRKDPQKVWKFYKERYHQSLSVEPNPAHYALKKLEDQIGDRFHLITQNVMVMHIRAGSNRVLEMHGSLYRCFFLQLKQEIKCRRLIF
jgi:NAD-dependent deacetylase